jgi:CHAT domain-containing protein
VSALDVLRAKLIDPLELKAKRLLISPHGEIAYLPICALVPDREVAYVPSGTIYCWLRSQPLVTGELVLAVGDPDYGQRVDPHAITLTRSGGKLTALPATRIEAKTVGDRVLLGRDASETVFLRVLKEQPRWRAVHLACHGLVNPAQPLHSSLALTADEQNDGFLKVLDIFGQSIVADLVVLSACETARGKVYKAEGVVGLTRAFMFAGASRVLASLWKVDDEATRALMIRFYELWNAKPDARHSAAAALRAAQAHVRSHDKWKHPSYWAAWQLWGLPD